MSLNTFLMATGKVVAVVDDVVAMIRDSTTVRFFIRSRQSENISVVRVTDVAKNFIGHEVSAASATGISVQECTAFTSCT